MTTDRTTAIAWVLAGLLLAAPATVYAMGRDVDSWWTNLGAFAAAALGAIALTLSYDLRPAMQISARVLAGGWLVAALGQVLWSYEVQLVGAAALVLAGLTFAVTSLSLGGVPHGLRTALLGIGFFSAAYAWLLVIHVPQVFGVVVIVLTGLVHLAGGLTALSAAGQRSPA